MAKGGTGFTVFFTGLPASGKSTLAGELHRRLAEIGGRPVTVFDGDVVRRQVSADLGYSRADREAQVERVSRLAADVTATGGIAICSLIAPYDSSRKAARVLIAPIGGFVLVYLSTPLSACEARDPKGLYAKAREGLITHFTGVSDPYEAPQDAEIQIDTSEIGRDEAVELVIGYLRKAGLI